MACRRQTAVEQRALEEETSEGNHEIHAERVGRVPTARLRHAQAAQWWCISLWRFAELAQLGALLLLIRRSAIRFGGGPVRCGGLAVTGCGFTMLGRITDTSRNGGFMHPRGFFVDKSRLIVTICAPAACGDRTLLWFPSALPRPS